MDISTLQKKISWQTIRLPRSPLLGIALGAMLGIVLGQKADPSSTFTFLLPPALAVVALLLLFTKRKKVGALLLTTVVFFLLHLYQTQNPLPPDLRAELTEGASVTIEGFILTPPTTSISGKTQRFQVRTEFLEFADERHCLTTCFLVQSLPDEYTLGQKWRWSGLLASIDRPRNPGQFDAPLYWERQGITGSLTIAHPEEKELLQPAPPLASFWVDLRTLTSSWITRSLEGAPERAALLPAIILGQRDGLSREQLEIFRHSGTMHIFAVSGLHVGIFAAILWILSKLIGIPRRSAILSIMALAFFYALLTGGRPSALRAAIMLGFVLGGQLFYRQGHILNSLSAAALLLLSWRTSSLYDPGFQLSFLVVSSILTFTPFFQNLWKKLTYRFGEVDPFLPPSQHPPSLRLRQKALHYLGDLWSVSTAAWLGSLIPILYYFHLLVPIGLLANLLFVPLAFVILLLGLISIMGQLIGLGIIAIACNQINGLIAHLTLILAQFFSQLPGGHFYLAPWSLSAPIATITILDLGQGGGAQILRQQNFSALLDTGSEPNFRWITLPALRYQGVEKLDALFLTHGDQAHVGGALSAIELLRPDHIASPSPSLHPTLRQISPSPPSALPIGLTLLYPPFDHRESRADDRARVYLYEKGPWKILFLGDSGFKTEKWLREHYPDLRAHIVVKGTHRDDFAGLLDLYDSLRPNVVIQGRDPYVGPEKNLLQTNLPPPFLMLNQEKTGAINIALFPEKLTLTSFLTGEKWTLTFSQNTPDELASPEP